MDEMYYFVVGFFLGVTVGLIIALITGLLAFKPKENKIDKFEKNKCQKIGEINRFGENKSYSCFDYLLSKHKQQFNPDFDFRSFCDYCKDDPRIQDNR